MPPGPNRFDGCRRRLWTRKARLIFFRSRILRKRSLAGEPAGVQLLNHLHQVLRLGRFDPILNRTQILGLLEIALKY